MAPDSDREEQSRPDAKQLRFDFEGDGSPLMPFRRPREDNRWPPSYIPELAETATLACAEYEAAIAPIALPDQQGRSLRRDVYAIVKRIASEKNEHLVGLYLDPQNRLLHSETIAVGSANIAQRGPSEIFLPAIQYLAARLILIRNHPSGSLDPSAEDLELTNSIRRAGDRIGIELYDHLIVTAAGYTSLRERGLI